MPANPLLLQQYDLLKGMEFVALWVMIVFCVVLIFSFRAQYRLMNTYDALDTLQPSQERRAQVMLAHVKRLLFSILGYQGEDRERQPLNDLDEKWVVANRGNIMMRFCIFYFVYIWALILTTRALLIEPSTGQVQILSYTSKQIFGFAMIGVYIITNAICDVFSIYFTVKYLEKVRKNPQMKIAATSLLKNLGYSFLFFLLSQLVSNLIWPLKTNVDISIVDRAFSPAIALWPYAFIVDANASAPQYIHPIFPGQLLITGTVFLPTLIIALLLVFSVLSIRAVGFLKGHLIARNITAYRVIVTASPGQQPVLDFRCINAFTVGIASSLVATLIFEWLRHMWSSA